MHSLLNLMARCVALQDGLSMRKNGGQNAM